MNVFNEERIKKVIGARAIKKAILYLLIVIVMTMFLFPMFWFFLASLNSEEAIRGGVGLLPVNPTLDSYAKVIFGIPDFSKAFINSLIVCVCTTVLVVPLASMAAYAFARLRFRYKRLIFFILWMGYIIPTLAVVTPMYFLSQWLGLYDTVFVLILCYSASLLPISIWLLRGFFLSVPREVEEAARVDGCSVFQAFWKVVVPLVKPGIAVAAVFTFIVSWNDFLFAIILTGARTKTIQVAMAQFVGEWGVNLSNLITGGFISMVPTVVLALLFQKYIIKGLTEGGIKG